jgi:pyruvate dehydrogenase E2 component (dihydrolipoamide acetyltransferase)
MAQKTAIKFPDLGGAQDVTVIEVLVNVGDQIELDQPLLTLEGDKATMEVPASVAGKIENLVIKVGDKVNEGDLIGHIALSEPDLEIKDSTVTTNKTINLPDLGGASDVTVIEILVAKGDSVSQDQPLITLEGDKATMEVPSPYAGVINEILLAVGDKVNEGDKVGTIAAEESSVPVDENIIEELTEEVQIELPQNSISDTGALLYAGPSVRRLAFEFGVDLNKVKATGPKGRLLKEDLQNYVKQAVKGGGTGIPEIPSVDFTKFGETTNKTLNKIKKLTGEFLTRNWLNIPHVTQHGYVDITDLEKIRQAHKGEFVAKGSRLTLLVFVVRALVKALQEFPSFNSSLSSDGSSLILKKYINIGFAVDTPNGLVVPVLKDVLEKDIYDLAKEIVDLSNIARSESGLNPGQLQGGCMTISSLGGIGGEFFTPIVNAPEVAILGLSKSSIQPIYDGENFQPRLMLPISLSYDHRVIDGAEGARFLVYFSEKLAEQSAIFS